MITLATIISRGDIASSGRHQPMLFLAMTRVSAEGGSSSASDALHRAVIIYQVLPCSTNSHICPAQSCCHRQTCKIHLVLKLLLSYYKRSDPERDTKRRLRRSEFLRRPKFSSRHGLSRMRPHRDIGKVKSRGRRSLPRERVRDVRSSAILRCHLKRVSATRYLKATQQTYIYLYISS